MQPEIVTVFQNAILRGDFAEALAVMPELTSNEPTRNQVAHADATLVALLACLYFLS